MDDICIIATGGTIDKEHDPITESLIFSEDSHVLDIIKQSRMDKVQHQVLMLKDSLDITDQDRKLIKEAIIKRPEKRIVVTHGTSTMTDTAEYLKKHITDKTVVLTGAMRPFSLFNSDAPFNLGSAITAASIADSGVYVAMNGKIFEAGSVKKNRETGIFEDT